jgi:pyrroline-5-carboxylate reductase
MKTVGIIGYGNMGSAIAEGVKDKYNIFVFEKDAAKTKDVKGITVVGSIRELIGKAGIIILAVKPQDFDALLDEIKDLSKDKLIISIAAGIETGYIEDKLRDSMVIRVMPNIAAKISQADTTICRGKKATQDNLDVTKEIFDHIGKTWIVSEDKMNPATAITGSGPAYIYYDMEIHDYDPVNLPESVKKDYIAQLTQAAEGVGFDSATAGNFASCTTASAIALSVKSGISPAELRRQVTSKGGTTEAAIKELEKGSSWVTAAKAALRRASELSKRVF